MTEIRGSLYLAGEVLKVAFAKATLRTERL
jgi:hypothetical protein